MRVNTAQKIKKLVLRPRQGIVQAEILNHFEDGAPAVILAGCPGFGKTVSSISIVRKVLTRYPEARVLVLTHGTEVLRTNYADGLKEYAEDLPFTWAVYLPKGHAEHIPFEELADKQVIVGLPQSLSKVEDLGHFDFVVTDEAHEFYRAPMVKSLIKRVSPRWQLLLTGTPGCLTNLGFPVIPITLLDNFEDGEAANPLIEIATSSYELTLDDYNDDAELPRSHKWASDQTRASLDDLMVSLCKRLQYQRMMPSGWNRLHEAGYKLAQKTLPDWKWLLRQLRKTMIACQSIKQADQVYAYFKKLGANVLVSHNENDTDSEAMATFRTDDSVQLLVVVRRGTLGYNFPDLAHVIDMTGSLNPERIYQLMTRVVRRSDRNPNKLFVKLAPSGPGMQDYTFAIMSLVMRLGMDAEFLRTWDGRLSSNPNVVTRKKRESKTDTDSTGSESAPKVAAPKPIDEDLLMFGPQGWQDLLTRSGSPLSPYKWTTVKDCVAACKGQVPFLPMLEAWEKVVPWNLKSREEWEEKTKDPNFPPDIPKSPYWVYEGFTKKGGWGWWLGTGTVHNKNFLPMLEAREKVVPWKLKNQKEWNKKTKDPNFPPDIPKGPYRVYKDEGFTEKGGMGWWLGTGTVPSYNKNFLPMLEAREKVVPWKLKSREEWEEKTKDPNFPPDIPKSPHTVYKDEGFTEKGGMGWWLGTGTVPSYNKNFLPMLEAREKVAPWKLKSKEEWNKKTKDPKFPPDIPKNPYTAYKDEGFTEKGGMGWWLGTGMVAPKNRTYLSMLEAREKVAPWNLKSEEEWNQKTKDPKFPPDIPKNPRDFYRDEGFTEKGGIGWWLGTGNKRGGKRRDK